jgi:protease-4
MMSILRIIKGRLRKDSEPEKAKRQTLASVMDMHMGSYVKVMNVNNTLKTMMILIGVALMLINMIDGGLNSRTKEHVGVVLLTGAIADGSPTGSGKAFATAFERATKDEMAKAILIVANSGGGSPVQAEIMNKLIADYTAKPLKDRLPVIVSMQEICASACIMALSHADEIYAHGNSMVGSISVRMDGWAIDKALQRLDIQRKVLKTGKYKDLLDPYRNLTADEEEFIETNLMKPLHESFVNIVKDGRKGKLDESNELLFTGMLWSGTDSKHVGLIDEVKTIYEVEEDLKQRYAIEEFKNYNSERMSFKEYFIGSVQNGIESALVTVMTQSMSDQLQIEMSAN